MPNQNTKKNKIKSNALFGFVTMVALHAKRAHCFAVGKDKQLICK